MVTNFNDPSARPSSESPNYIEPNHLKEWLDSGVDRDIIALNVRSLSGNNPYEYLLYGLDDTQKTSCESPLERCRIERN
jgi:hypothetical protein